MTYTLHNCDSKISIPSTSEHNSFTTVVNNKCNYRNKSLEVPFTLQCFLEYSMKRYHKHFCELYFSVVTHVRRIIVYVSNINACAVCLFTQLPLCGAHESPVKNTIHKNAYDIALRAFMIQFMECNEC